MNNKRTIYGIALIIICIMELTGLVQHSAGWKFIVACSNLDMIEMGIYFILSLPLVLLIIAVIWQLRNKKALQCKKLMLISMLYQLYILQTFMALIMDTPDNIFKDGNIHSILSYITWRNFLDICIVLLFFFLVRSFRIESLNYEEVRITWQSIYRRRVPVIICIILLIAGVVGYPYVKYEYYERSPYYYRVDEEGYTPASYLTNYIIHGTGILEQADSYYRCDRWGNYKIGWVFNAKKAGDVTLTVQQYYRGGDIERRIYTIHVDQDKKIKGTKVKEIRIREKIEQLRSTPPYY